MENTLHITAIWLHILGIALFVGPQFFLAFAWPAASRQIADPKVRLSAMSTLTRRFGYIGGTGLLLLLVAGTYLISTWRDFYSQPDDIGFTDIRYGVIFTIKMTVLIVMLIVIGIHTFVVGPRLVRTLEAQANGEPVTDADVRKARMMSRTLSVTGLLLALVIMVMGVMLSTTSFSFKDA